ncbi:MAG TPA: hypothetical protein DCW46_08410 [Desulfotomaculum sp.]|nr:hypothetical protein [Desulfotomaculum sp.]
MRREMRTKIVAIYACPVCNAVLQAEYLDNYPHCACGLKMELAAASVMPFYQAEKILKRRAFPEGKRLISEPLFAEGIQRKEDLPCLRR